MSNPGGADPRLLERLREVQRRFQGVNESLASPDVIQNIDRIRVLGQERAELEPVVRAADELMGLVKEYEGAVELLHEATDQEFREMAGDEVASLEARIEALGAEARLLLIPKDPLDDRAAVVEIRAGTGGDEAGLFAKDLFRMYQRVAERGTSSACVAISSNNSAYLGCTGPIAIRRRACLAARPMSSGSPSFL